MKRLLLTFAVTCSLFPLKAQEVLTLEQCLKTGIENNLSLETKRNDIPRIVLSCCPKSMQSLHSTTTSTLRFQ